MSIVCHYQRERSGFSTLLMIVAIGAAALVMATSATFIAMGELELTVLDTDQEQLQSLTEYCIEDGLASLRREWPDAAVEKQVITLSEESSCSWWIALDGEKRNVSATATLDGYHQLITASVSGANDLTTFISLDTWNE